MKRPAFQFYIGDHKKDPCVAACSCEARGFWQEVTLAMKEAESCSVSGTVQQLAQIARTDPETTRRAITELRATKTADVYERAGKITIVSRRYRRELHISQLAVNRQRKRRARLRAPELSRSSHDTSAASSSTAVAAAAAARLENFPRAVAFIHQTYPGTDELFVARILAAAVGVCVDITDRELEEALIQTAQKRRQRTAGLWLTTLPAHLRQIERTRPCQSCGGERRIFNPEFDSTPPSQWPRDETRLFLPCPHCSDVTRKPPVSESAAPALEASHG